jgi:pimeloyl-ACP methyl ester carboxylesterase
VAAGRRSWRPWPSATRFTRRFTRSIQRRAAIAKFVWPIPDKGLSKRLHRVTAPTLLLWDEADRVNPPANGEAWRSRIKDAVLTALPGGHMLLYEASQRAIPVTQAFLRAR